ncbi:hypothetical protein ABBQ32_002219 [Trebouxia sp. C0010 RCD-2024]
MTKRDRQDTPDWQQEVPYKPYAQNDKDFEIKYKSSCLCGKVEYAVNSDPCAAKFCHCTGCQRLHGAPFQWAAVYHKKNVRFLKGVDNIGFLNTQDRVPKRELPAKVSCITCHSPIASEGRNMWMAFPTLFDFEDRKIPACFQPDCHIFYSQRCMDVNDGMPKWSGHKEDSDKMEEVKSKHNVS